MYALLLSLLVGAGPAAKGEVQEIQHWPLTEAVGYHWKNELVFFPLAEKVPLGQEGGYSVTDEAGRPLPFQAWQRPRPDGRTEPCVALLIDLPPFAKRSFTLHRGGNPVKKPDATRISEEPGRYILRAGRTAVRVARAEGFRPGTPFAKLPAPLQAIQGHSGRWLGEGTVAGDQPVVKFTTTIEADGPLFAQVAVRYEFGLRQFYQLRVRVVAGEDVALVEEDFALPEDDLKRAAFVTPPNLAPAVGQSSRYNDWMLGKGIGWRNIPTDVGRYPCFRFNFTKGWGADRVRGTGIGQAKKELRRADLAHAEQDWRLGLVLTPYQERGYRQNAVGFDTPDGPDYLGLFYRFGSRWVHPNENRVLLPWLEEGVVGHFLAYEGHREWGLLVTANGPQTEDKFAEHGGSVFGTIHKPHVKHGETPLDKVKDWVLTWEAPAAAVYPRLYMSPEGLARIKREFPTLAADVKKAITQDHLAHALLTSNQALLQQEFAGHTKEFRQACVRGFLDGGHNTPDTYTHRYQEVIRSSARALDIALSCPTLTAEERQRTLALVAFLAYKTSDLDYWPHHAYGGGPSNPNMMTIATHAVASCAGLLPGHPRQKDWLRLCERLTCADIETSIGPDGEWLECPGYQGAGNTPMNQTVLILRNSGTADLTTHPVYGRRLLDVSRYFANLLTPPDPRFGGKRMPMALGDNIPFFNNHYVYLAHAARTKFPTQAGLSVWCFNQMGRPIGQDALLLLHEHVLDGSIPEVALDGRSVSFPAFGAMLRHGFGGKHETYLTYRQSNFAYGHYDDDQGSFSLFAKGAPLCLDWIDYSPGKAEHHNRVDYREKYPWLVPAPDKVELHAEADYVRSREAADDQAPPQWTRQLVLVKDNLDPGDATYLVVRDRIDAPGPSTWNVWTLAKKGSEKIAGPVARLEGQFGVDLSLFFYRAPQQPLTSTFLQHRTQSYLQIDQDQTRIQARADKGGDYGVVLYPLRRGVDKEPIVRALASGVVEVSWSPERRHLIFLFPEVREVREGDISFRGRAAVVKIDGGKRRLVPLECEELK